MSIEQRYTSFEKAKNYTKQYELDAVDAIVTKQEDGYLGYISAGQFATTGSNIFTGGQILVGNLTIDGDIFANTFNVTTVSVSHFSASTTFGLDTDDTHTFTGSVYITGSLNVIGGINGVINATNGVISSSAQITSFGFVSGSYETTGRGIVSGSSQITPLLPAGVVSGSAQITSFGFVSGSYETTGRGIISSSTQIKNYGDFATTGSNLFRGDQTISGSTNVDYIIFNSQSAAPLVSYMLQANTTDKTLDLRTGNNATVQLGQEMHFPLVVNESGADLTDGTLVMFNPADISQGNRISVVKAVTDGTHPADRIVGVLTEDIAHHASGFATWFGYVRDLPKTQVQPAGETWAEGDILYPNPAIAGGLTKVFPTAPNLRITVATITRINGNNVTIMVNFHKRTALKRAHDVLDNSTTSSYGDILVKSGSVWTNSKTLNGDYTISGSLFISGTTEFGGDLVPKTARGATLGTELRPFKGIFVSSGSINIASDVIGDPNTTLSNVGGNILVSAGGMRLVGSAAFIAATGSFQYISGSMTQIGDYSQTGDYTMVGDKTITGSLQITGSGFINTRRILTDLDSGSYAITGSNTFSGSQGISGSLYVSDSVYATDEFYLNGNKLFNYGQFSDTTTQSGSANTAYSMKFNTTDISHYVSVVSGSRLTVANTGIYNLQFSAQLDNTSNTNEIVDIWVAITGSNVANSNTQVAINKAQAGNSGKLVAAWNYMLPLSASNYVELKWSSSGGGIILHSSGSVSNPTRPAIPSVIATITQIA